jgi:putative oxidoreductase
VNSARSIYNRIAANLDVLISHDLLAAIARASIAALFLQSGRTKVEGWLSVSDSAVELFRDEYQLPLLSPELAAHVSAYAEHLFPLLLVLGLFTRASAVALLGMTAVIEIFVYPGAYATHGTWAAVLLYLIARGPGAVSVDHWLWRRPAGSAAR